MLSALQGSLLNFSGLLSRIDMLYGQEKQWAVNFFVYVAKR